MSLKTKVKMFFFQGAQSFAFPFGSVFDLLSNKLEWKSSTNGNVPGDAINLYYFNTARHFCRVAQVTLISKTIASTNSIHVWIPWMADLNKPSKLLIWFLPIV